MKKKTSFPSEQPMRTWEELEALREQRCRPSLKTMPITATWPKLQRFMDEVLSVEGTTYTTCSDATWYGWNSQVHRGIKARLRKFFGWETPGFFAAYRALYGSLKTCRHCLERDPREADIEANIARRLRAQGIHPVETQVRTPAGIADIVTPTTVYEVKLSLTRVSLFQAVGQVSLYARELERPNRVIVGAWTPDTDRLAARIRLLGIDVEAW